MINFLRKMRYWRELEALEYHRYMRDSYIQAGARLCKDFGLVRNQVQIRRYNAFVEYHRSVIKHLKAKINGGAE